MKYEVSNSKYIGLILEIKAYFSKAKESIYEGRNSLKIIQYADTDLVIKSFKIPHIINKIAYTFFRDSKAKKSYIHSMKMLEFTPEPIGYIEYFKFGLLAESYYVCKAYKYDFTIREPLVDVHFEHRNEVFKAFAKFTYTLHNYNIEHLDYSPGNILIKVQDGGYEFKVIDVNRMRFRQLSPEERIENFSKLWARNEDLKMIVTEYAALIEMDKDEAIDIALKASQKHKDKKNLKKRLKGNKVVD